MTLDICNKTTDNLLEVSNLKLSFLDFNKEICIVNELSFCVRKGEMVGIVGESGCGKSLTGLAVAGLLDTNRCMVSGEINISASATMVYQDAYSSLNPVLTIKKQLTALVHFHQRLSRKKCFKKAVELLGRVGIEDPERVLSKYPWQLSGGMAQRVCIAMALAGEPKLLVADEPTTALDNLTGATVMATLKKLQKELGLTIILISHDLASISVFCDRLMVMYSGRLVEEGDAETLLANPWHPYTRGLVATFLALQEGCEDINPIEGNPPNYLDLPSGCTFHPRCKQAKEHCFFYRPTLLEVEKDRKVACHEIGGK